jgi:hypothetical protein
MDDNSARQRFQATNGRVTGWIGLGAAAVVLVLALVDFDSGTPLVAALGALLGGLVVWMVMLRPALWTEADDLVMRGIVRTDRIPLASIDKVAVGQVLAVSAGGHRYVSPVVGYTVRQTVRARSAGAASARQASNQDPRSPVGSYQDFVEDRIAHLAKEHRERRPAAGPVRRSYAWLEIAGVVGLVAAIVVWALV